MCCYLCQLKQITITNNYNLLRVTTCPGLPYEITRNFHVKLHIFFSENVQDQL